MPHSVFISYSSQDAATARAVCAELEGRGVRCWIAPRNAVPGIPYARQLVDAINNCEVVLLVLSANANASRAVLNEIELATNRAKPVLPFRIEDVMPASDLEFYIRSVQWLDAMSKPLPDAVADLMHALEGLITPATASYETTPSPEHNLPSSLTHLVGREDDVIQLEALLETSR
ncbi:MAG: toll/interleukin-1 receptor domain-containing protein, partial [Candidatus Eremiobacteraeota bacterium]|nr:toll/interleukin-1 receptor domain-containing protein [Candidatus Eremiobacteraeota bacterium]